MKVGLRRGKIVVVRPEHDHGAPSYGPGGLARTSTAARASRAGCAVRRPHGGAGGPQRVLVPDCQRMSMFWQAMYKTDRKTLRYEFLTS